MTVELWSIGYTSVLPLEFIDFKAILAKDDAELDWKTASEINTKEFIIERSFNGNDFSAVGKTEAANIAGTNDYHFTDINVSSLPTSVLYYRLKQVDLNGKLAYSKVVSLLLGNSSRIALYPNPAVNNINVLVSSSRKEKLGCIVFDNIGRTVMVDSKQVNAGSNQISIDINKLPAGVYYLKLNGHSISERFQFVKQ